jgi:hypothetical protein
MTYSLKEFSKTEQYQKHATEHSKAMIFLSVMTSIVSSFISDIDVSWLRHAIVFFVWSLFGTSILIALPSFMLMSWTALRRMELEELGKPHQIYGFTKTIVYLIAVALVIFTTLIALGRFNLNLF